ncbi:MAG: hypothetical protein V3U16_02500 [Candidatus Neomarinimicrobiota bacterium]
MGIDFDKEESRAQYLNQKLDGLLSEINNYYGKVLLDELTFRLEKTLSDFNAEVQVLFDKLKENAEDQGKILKRLKESEKK